MIIRRESFLPVRNFAVHEAAHYLIGKRFNLPVLEPEVFADGSGGRVALDRPQIERTAATTADEDIPQEVMAKAARQVCCMYLAGHAAEAIAAGADTDHIIGRRTPDLYNAGEILEKCGLPDSILEEGWRDAVRILREMWPAVVDLARTVPLTNGSHNPPVS